MIEPSSTFAWPGLKAAATWRIVSGEIALQSMNVTGAGRSPIAADRRPATPIASPGGTIDRTISAPMISSSGAGFIPAALARSWVSGERPSR
jgi:hypothetical protein